MRQLAKLVEYAYPYSPLAIKMGFAETGCYYVALYPAIDAHFGGMPIDNTFTNNKAIATQHANDLPEPWNHFHYKAR